VVVLDSDITLEPELRRCVPSDVEYHVARVQYPHGVTPEALATATARLEDGIRSLLSVQPGVLVWACTSGSFYDGRDGNGRILAEMQKVANGIPCMTASSAVVNTLHRLLAKRIGVVSPYPPAINRRLSGFLREEGFEVTDLQALFDGVVDDYTLQTVPAERIRAAAARAAAHADAVLISCTGLATIDLLDDAARAFGMPVVSSNAAIACEALRALRHRGPAPGFGALQEDLRARAAKVVHP
jgi:maleate isomerase